MGIWCATGNDNKCVPADYLFTKAPHWYFKKSTLEMRSGELLSEIPNCCVHSCLRLPERMEFRRPPIGTHVIRTQTTPVKACI